MSASNSASSHSSMSRLGAVRGAAFVLEGLAAEGGAGAAPAVGGLAAAFVGAPAFAGAETALVGFDALDVDLAAGMGGAAGAAARVAAFFAEVEEAFAGVGFTEWLFIGEVCDEEVVAEAERERLAAGGTG